MAIIFYILGTALSLYVYVLLARVVLDLVQVFSRDWRPTGFLLVLAEIVYTLTDPPIRFLRRWITPINVGGISLDLAVILLFFACWFGQMILLSTALALR